MKTPLGRGLLVGALALSLAACAASRSPPAPEAATPASPAAGGAQVFTQPTAPPGQPGYPAQSSQYAPPPPPPPQPSTPLPKEPDSPGRSPARDFEAAERQLMVAAGDCANACRALSSMDRAAGQICTLASNSDDQQRCSTVKSKVQSARDKVKSSCGECKETSTDRNAPIPSSR